MAYWILRSEPETYGWDDLVREKGTEWDGVRNYTAREWSGWIEGAGMRVEHVEPLRAKRYDFADWSARMRMPEAERAALESWLLAAPPRSAEAFQIVVADGRVKSLSGTYGIIVAEKVM